MARKRRSFTREFKPEAVSLVTDGALGIARAARDLGISESVLDAGKSSSLMIRRRPFLEMCGALEVSPGGYHAWPRRPESRRVCEDRRLVVEIKAIHEQKRGAHGSWQPRMKAKQTHHGKKRVARLMRGNGLRGRAAQEVQGNHGFQTRSSRGAQPVAA